MARFFTGSTSILFLATAFLASFAGGAWAEPAAHNPLELDSIMVTAQKVKTDKQDVPSTISVFDSQTIQDLNLNSLEQLGILAPNIGFSKIDEHMTQVVFRGVGGMSNMNKVWNINVDGVALPYVGIDTGLDVDRVEIMRGSQGALYGRNTHAGAINIITKDPGDRLNAFAKLNYESYHTLKAQAAVGSPITDDASYRLAVGYKSTDGYFRNKFLDKDDTNKSEQFTARGKVLLKNDDAGKLTLSMYADKYEGGFDCYGPPNGSLSLETQSNRRGHNDGYLLAPTLTWEKDLGPVTLTSITTYSRSNYNYLQDWDYTPMDLMYPTNDEDFNTLSQELRLNGGPDNFRWMVGLFGLTERIDTKTDIVFGDDAGNMWMTPGDHMQQNSTVCSNIASAFGQIIWRVLPMIEVTGAARFDYERKSLDWENKTNIMGMPTGSLNMNKEWTAVSPSISLAWLFTERQRVYASVARGFKAGDFNNVMVEESLVKHAVDPEYTTTYEVGYKGKLLDNRLELSAALFYVDWDNMQVDIESPTGVFSNYQKMNAGRAHSSGFEVEARALLMPGWEVFASAGYMFDYKFDEFKKDDNTDLAGKKLPFTNAYTLGAGSVFRLDSGFFMSVDGSLNGRKYLLEDNSLRQPAYALVNAKIGYEKDNWDVFLYGRNLLDQRYATSAFGRSKRAAEPLMVGVQCGLSF